MTNGEYKRIKAQIAVLRDLLADYSHKTLDNVLQGLEARVREAERTCITEGYNHEEDEQKRVEDMLLKKIDEFLSKYTTFNVNQNKRNDDKLLDAVAFIARGCAIIGWNECFNYHFSDK